MFSNIHSFYFCFCEKDSMTTSLDVGGYCQTRFHSLLGQDSRPQHDGGVAGVGARGDGGDQHWPMSQNIFFVVKEKGNTCREFIPRKAKPFKSNLIGEAWQEIFLHICSCHPGIEEIKFGGGKQDLRTFRILQIPNLQSSPFRSQFNWHYLTAFSYKSLHSKSFVIGIQKSYILVWKHNQYTFFYFFV